jgi:hypothetical protein
VSDINDDTSGEDVADEREPSLLDVIVFGPVDAAFALLRDPRGPATRGRGRVEQAVRQARALGELTVRFGSSELRRRTSASSAAPSEPATAAIAQPVRDAGPAPDDVIADYDALSASQIVPMLASLSHDERTRVAEYEQRARGRQTVLRRIAQLDEAGA